MKVSELTDNNTINSLVAIARGYKIEVTRDETGEVVKTLTYKSKRELEKGYKGLLINMNLAEYTAKTIEPDDVMEQIR